MASKFWLKIPENLDENLHMYSLDQDLGHHKVCYKAYKNDVWWPEKSGCLVETYIFETNKIENQWWASTVGVKY